MSTNQNTHERGHACRRAVDISPRDQWHLNIGELYKTATQSSLQSLRLASTGIQQAAGVLASPKTSIHANRHASQELTLSQNQVPVSSSLQQSISTQQLACFPLLCELGGCEQVFVLRIGCFIVQRHADTGHGRIDQVTRTDNLHRSKLNEPLL